MSLCDQPEAVAFCAANPVVGGLDAAGQAVGSAAQAAFDAWARGIAEAAAEGLGRMVSFMVTWWVSVPGPPLDQQQGPVAEIQRHLAWVTALAAMFGLVIAGAKLAFEQRGGTTLRDMTKGLVQWVLLSAGGTAAIALLTDFGHGFAGWIIHRASGADLGAALAKYVVTANLISSLGTFLTIVVAIIAILAALVQALLMFARAAVLVYLAGMLPLSSAAAISGTPLARATLQRHLTWITAFVLFEPAAAIVYAGAFWMTGQGRDSASQLSGIFMIILASAALPALLRLIAPLVEGMTHGGGSSGAGAAVGTAAASGARVLTTLPTGRGGGNAARSGDSGGNSAGLVTAPRGASTSSVGKAGAGQAAAAGPAGGGAAAAGPAAAGVAAGVAAYRGVKGTAQQGAAHGTGSPESPQSNPSGAKDNKR